MSINVHLTGRPTRGIKRPGFMVLDFNYQPRTKTLPSVVLPGNQVALKHHSPPVWVVVAHKLFNQKIIDELKTNPVAMLEVMATTTWLHDGVLIVYADHLGIAEGSPAQPGSRTIF